MDLRTAVVTYLDAEHYMYLHSDYEQNYRIVQVSENKVLNRCDYKLLFFNWIQEATTTYNPPAEFIQSDIKFYGNMAFVMNYLFRVTTTMRYSETDDPEVVRSDIRYDIEVPFFLFPFMFIIKRMLKKLKWEKDLEDVEMCDRRKELFGANAVEAYYAPHQFILFKDLFVKYFPQKSDAAAQAIE